MKRGRKIILIPVIGVLLLIFCFSGYKIASYFLEARKEEEAFQQLAEIVKNLEQEATESTEFTGATDETAPVETQKKEESSQLLPLQVQNPDFFGWLRIEGTRVDYPVMHTPDDEEYYLHRAFDKSYAKSGTPFLAAGCFENCGNYLIYGHNMKNGSMFASILQYEKKAFWEQHKTIAFHTLQGQAEYEVIAAFRAEVVKEGNSGFAYYQYTDLTTQGEFDAYVAQVKQHADFDTGLTAEFGDQLLTLSTCAYHTDEGRFVVVAKKVK